MSLGDFLAVIPARAGSKRLPRKNVLPLAGKAMLGYTIEAALGCSLCGGVYVSSEDAEVLRLAAEFGAEVIGRPAALASDATRNVEVVHHAIETLASRGLHYRHVVLLQPTSPLRTSRHLEACLSAYVESGARSTLSVCAVACHPRAMMVVRNGFVEPYEPGADLDERIDSLPPAYQPNGAIHALATETFLLAGRFVVAPCLAYYMGREESIDVDTAFDLALAETVLRARAGGSQA